MEVLAVQFIIIIISCQKSAILHSPPLQFNPHQQIHGCNSIFLQQQMVISTNFIPSVMLVELCSLDLIETLMCGVPMLMLLD